MKTFNDIQQEIAQYIYTEDPGMLRISLASIIATRIQKSDPVWLLLIGASSSGKSQILRPLALTDSKFIHRVDDLTENTFLSGMKVKKGEKDISLLKKIGARGIIVISDFTVIFSKSSESRAAILGQFRMVYDGEMTKYSGVSPEPITWKGSLGILAGSTPSVYTHFEEVADMGERFIYYRMKPYDTEKATRISLNRTMYGAQLDETVSDICAEYIKDVVSEAPTIDTIPEEAKERILKIAMFAALLRTPTHYDKFAKVIDKIPTPEMPMRVALQLSSLARGLMLMQYHDTKTIELSEQDISYIEWCAYSLANEERRACLKVLAKIEKDTYISSQTIADTIGLNTTVVTMNLQHLSAIGVVTRTGDGGSLKWRITHDEHYHIIRRLEGIDTVSTHIERELSQEEFIGNSSDLDEF